MAVKLMCWLGIQEFEETMKTPEPSAAREVTLSCPETGIMQAEWVDKDGHPCRRAVYHGGFLETAKEYLLRAAHD